VPKEFINPNLHVILIHYPLGLLVVGTLIEFFAFLGWRRSAFRAAGRWMLLIGILSLTPTLFSGLYALADVNRTADTPDDATWAEIRQQSPIQGQAWDLATKHAWSNAIGSVVLLVTLVLWMGSSDDWRRKLHLIWLLLLIGGLGTLVYGAFFGGEMIYRHGVGVVDDHVGRLQQRIAEEAVGGEVAIGDLLLLLLVGRDALEPRRRRDHRQQQVQLGVLRHQRLDEQRALLRVDAGGDPVGDVVDAVGHDVRRVGVLARQRVPIGHEVEAVEPILELDPVAQRADQVPEMELSRRAHPRHDTLVHHDISRTKAMNRNGGWTM